MATPEFNRGAEHGRKLAWAAAIGIPIAAAFAARSAPLDRVLRHVYATDPPGPVFHFDYYFHRFYLAMERPVLLALGAFGVIVVLIAASNSRHRLPTGTVESRAADRSKRAFLALIAVACLTFVAASAIGAFALLDFPNSADEWGFQLQARTFAEGRLWRDADDHPLVGVLGTSYFVTVKEGRLFTTHFPGWSALLAVGYRLGVPRCVNPMLAALTIVFVFLAGRALFGDTAALFAAILCAASPFFLFNSASYFSQPTTLFCTAVSIWALAHGWRSPSRRAAMLAGLLGGFAVGLQFLARPYSAVAASAPIAVALLCAGRGDHLGRHTWTRLLPWFPGVIVASALLLSYNKSFTGRYFLTPYAWAENPHLPGFFADGYVVHTPLDGIVQALGHLVDLHAWLCFGTLLALIPLLGRLRDRRVVLLLSIPLSITVAYVFFPSYGGNQYGPRYLYEAVAPIVLLAGRGAVLAGEQWESRLGPGRSRLRVRLVLGIALIANLAVLVYYGAVQHRVVVERSVPRSLAASRGITDAVILLETGAGTMERTDLIRNDPCCSSPVIWADSPRAVELDAGVDTARRYVDALRTAFADRRVYVFRYGEPGERGPESECVTWPPPRSGERSELVERRWDDLALRDDAP